MLFSKTRRLIMQKMNETRDGDIVILRHRPCNNTYVQKKDDDEILYSKEEWDLKQKKEHLEEEMQKATSVKQSDCFKRYKKSRIKNIVEKPSQKTPNFHKISELKRKMHAIKNSVQTQVR